MQSDKSSNLFSQFCLAPKVEKTEAIEQQFCDFILNFVAKVDEVIVIKIDNIVPLDEFDGSDPNLTSYLAFVSKSQSLTETQINSLKKICLDFQLVYKGYTAIKLFMNKKIHDNIDRYRFLFRFVCYHYSERCSLFLHVLDSKYLATNEFVLKVEALINVIRTDASSLNSQHGYITMSLSVLIDYLPKLNDRFMLESIAAIYQFFFINNDFKGFSNFYKSQAAKFIKQLESTGLRSEFQQQPWFINLSELIPH